MKKLLPLLIFALVLLPPFALGAQTGSQVWVEWYAYDYENDTLLNKWHMKDGGTYRVPLGVPRAIEFGSNNGEEVDGFFYFINPDTGERELVEYTWVPYGQFHSRGISWDRQGVYEFDFYYYEPQLSRSLWDKFLAIFLPNLTYAQEDDEWQQHIDGTIRFTILEGEDCCANVLFLPGIKGSRLQIGTDTIWPPTITINSNDLLQLSMNESGESLNDVRVSGVMNTFYGASIYKPFSEFMDELVLDEKIFSWSPFAYDWRFMPERVIRDGVKTPNGDVVDLLEEVEILASNSRTGKVVIIAHSMGGLLGKALIKELEQQGKAGLVESFVMVATPQLGTPQAAAALLHGEGEGIPDVWFLPELIASSVGMRVVAQNIPAGYNLLPSQRYFQEVSDPVITFDPRASFTKTWRDFWGDDGINDHNNFSAFLMGTGVSRNKPLVNVLRRPEVLNPGLLAGALDFHSEYDNYQLPSNIRGVQVAGWGLPTTKALRYRTRHFLESYETIFTREGDGTVVYPSAVSVNGEVYFFNIFDYNDLTSDRKNHGNILGSFPIQFLVEKLLEKKSVLETSFITTIKPESSSVGDQLIVSAHSPVILGAHDEFGNFTGISPNQNFSSDTLLISEDIPGSSFIISAENQYLFLPKEGTYQVSYRGIGEGPTTVEIQNFIADTATLVASYSDIPTFQGTVATLSVDSSVPENTIIEVDVDGDGEVDEMFLPDSAEEGQDYSLSEIIAILKTKIGDLDIKQNIKNNLLKRLDLLEKRIGKKKERNAKILTRLDQQIAKNVLKGKIEVVSANEITALLDALEAQSDSLRLDSEVLTELRSLISNLNAKASIKNSLLRRVDNLEKKQGLIKTLSNLVASVGRKGVNGKIPEIDAEEIINLISKIEGVL